MKPLNDQTKPEELKEGGGLRNMAELLAKGYTVAAYIMSTKTRAEVDAWIAAHPNGNKPFNTAPTEIDESEPRIQVRLEPPSVDLSDNESIAKQLATMASVVEKTLPENSGVNTHVK